MVIDLSRCVGCNSCTLACKVSNGTPPAMFFSHVDIEEQGTYPDAMNIYTPRCACTAPRLPVSRTARPGRPIAMRTASCA
ncbi:4Fe-4S binding protein [uncultured Adlercreutzia sp.]|uniref:4Fe-4S binding protein n=1 Tax=uncultured Adlercreutzia sp. TaxID=875803 RepID=UPI0034A204CC